MVYALLLLMVVCTFYSAYDIQFENCRSSQFFGELIPACDVVIDQRLLSDFTWVMVGVSWMLAFGLLVYYTLFITEPKEAYA